MTPELQDKLSRLPSSPGVYIMRGARNEIIYIGKATRLKERVRSYFNGTDSRAFVYHLNEFLHDLEYVLTQNAKEALLLENTLIKKHKPRFNIMLRDDKNYLSIRIDFQHAWPRVDLVRKIRNDGAKYFGPYHSASKARETLNILNKHFMLRTCRDSVLNNRSRPCLQYQIRRCPAPCVLPISRDEYMDNVQHAAMFLSNKERELVPMLTVRMERAAEELLFEEAARLRDQVRAISDSLQAQSAVQTTHVEQDVIGLFREGDIAAITTMVFRDGSLRDIVSFDFRGQVFPDDEILSSFVALYYGHDHMPPAEILLPCSIDESETWEEVLSELRQKRVRLLAPSRGEKRKLVELACENARAHFNEKLSTDAQVEQVLAQIQKKLDLQALPRTMECYDISNFQGAFIVASQVCFQDGIPDKSRYRRLKIRSKTTQDDFASIFEVIARRARRARQDNEPLPDLIVIDGGKGQLASAVAALRSEGVMEQAIVGLAKARAEGTDADDKIEHSEERLFVPGRKNPIILKSHTGERFLFERIRDEAHRTAVGFHRQLRSSATIRSRLEDIPGVGSKKTKLLLQVLGSLKAVRAASLKELEAVSGLGKQAAASVFSHFHPDAFDAAPGSDDGQ